MIFSGFAENPRDWGFFESRDFYPWDLGFFTFGISLGFFIPGIGMGYPDKTPTLIERQTDQAQTEIHLQAFFKWRVNHIILA